MVTEDVPEGRHGIARAVGVLGPHVIGLRVVVRRVLPGETGPSGGPAMTDVLGICESWQDGLATVRREDGSLAEIPTADIVSGKPVPPRPSVHRRLGAAEADRLTLPGWQPVENEPLGAWSLRASGGFSSRANSVLALGQPGLPLDEAVARVAEWYATRSLPARAQVHLEGPETEAFSTAGWTAHDQTLLMLSSVSRVLRRLAGDAAAEPRHDTTLDAGWLATDERAVRYGEDARTVLEAGEVTFATVRDAQGAVLAWPGRLPR